MEKDIASIRKLLTLMAIPLVLYVLNILSVIFIPLAFGLFSALLFTPALRWLTERKVPKFLGLTLILIVVLIGGYFSYRVVQLSSHELTKIDAAFVERFEVKLNEIAEPINKIMKIEPINNETQLGALLNNEKVLSNLFSSVGSGINIAKDVLTMLIMSAFFMLLFLAGSVNVQDILQMFVFQTEDDEISRETYHQIERGVFTFVSVKTFLSVLTGLGIGLSCYFFGVSFPIFWGLAAFLLNYIQIIGSVLVVVVLALFALVELEFTSSLIFFVIIITGLQFAIGNILEPVLLGRSFSINTVTVLVMLSIWGMIWGLSGMVLSIPITAMMKVILEKFPSTEKYAKIMS